MGSALHTRVRAITALVGADRWSARSTALVDANLGWHWAEHGLGSTSARSPRWWVPTVGRHALPLW